MAGIDQRLYKWIAIQSEHVMFPPLLNENRGSRFDLMLHSDQIPLSVPHHLRKKKIVTHYKY